MQTQVSTQHTASALHCPICQAMMGVTVVEGPGGLDKIRYACSELNGRCEWPHKRLSGHDDE